MNNLKLKILKRACAQPHLAKGGLADDMIDRLPHHLPIRVIERHAICQVRVDSREDIKGVVGSYQREKGGCPWCFGAWSFPTLLFALSISKCRNKCPRIPLRSIRRS